MPNLTEFNGCFIADRSNLKSKINALKGKKTSTRLSVFESIVKARRYIDNNFSEKITLKEITKIACLSQSHLMREFKKAYDMSIYEYVIERKMAHARYLLNSTDLKVSSISDECGYESLGSFISIFTRIHHISPLQYRRQQK